MFLRKYCNIAFRITPKAKLRNKSLKKHAKYTIRILQIAAQTTHTWMRPHRADTFGALQNGSGDSGVVG